MPPQKGRSNGRDHSGQAGGNAQPDQIAAAGCTARLATSSRADSADGAIRSIAGQSFHTGIDLSAPYTSPVYATAAGTVTYAGYRSEYGKVVEIDHGNGISTLLRPSAPLHRLGRATGRRAHADRVSRQHRAQLRAARSLRSARQRRTPRSGEVHRARPSDPGREQSSEGPPLLSRPAPAVSSPPGRR